MQKLTLPQAGQKVKEDFLQILKTYPIFSDWEDEALLWSLIREAKIEALQPHVPKWQADDRLELSIVLDGLFAVNYSENNLEGIDGFILKGQLLADFDFLQAKIRRVSITTLTQSKVLRFNEDAILSIRKANPELLYTLCGASVGSKYHHKSILINILKHNKVIERIKHLLSAPRHDADWMYLFRGPGKSYEINILWSAGNLESLLSTDYRSIKERLTSLIKDRVIAIDLYEKISNHPPQKRHTLSEGDMERYVRKINHYFKIRVLNENELNGFSYIEMRSQKKEG